MRFIYIVTCFFLRFAKYSVHVYLFIFQLAVTGCINFYHHHSTLVVLLKCESWNK